MTAVASVLLLSLPLARALALPRPPTPAAATATSIPAAKPLVVCTSAGSLEGLGFCRAAVSSGAYRVRALTRSLTSARTRQLEAIGAEVVVADNHDPSALEAAFAGAAAVYGITTWSGSTFAADGSVRRPADVTSESLLASEVAQGLNIIAAAEAADVGHFVLQSMHRGGLRDGEPSADGHRVDASVPAPLHHRAKWRQEEALRASSLRRWSILRQPTYLENFGNDALAAKGTRLRLLQPGVVSGLLAPETELTVIAVDDLGQLALAIVKEGDAYHGRTLAAGAERISGRALAAAAGRVNPRVHFAYRPVPWAVLRFAIPVAYPRQLRRWLARGGNDEGAAADADAAVFAESRRLHPGTLTSVEAWLEARGVGAFEPPPAQRLAAALSRWTTWRLEAAADIRAPKGAASPDAPAAAGRVEGSRQVA